MSSAPYICGVSPMYTLICFGGTLPQPINQIIFLCTGDGFYGEFWQYMLMPLTAASSILAHFTQPTSTSPTHLLLLHVFSTGITSVNEIMGMIGSAMIGWDQFLTDLPSRISMLLGWQILFFIARYARGRISLLPQPQLSNFLTRNLIVQGFSGLGPVIFLTFDTVRCANEVFGETGSLNMIEVVCRRTLIAQLFLGGFLGVYIMARLFVSVLPRNVIRKHYITIYELATFRVNAQQMALLFFGALILLSSMYLVGNIGAEGSMSVINEKFTFAIGFCGLFGIVSIVTWKLIVVRKDLQEEDKVEEVGEAEEAEEAEGGGDGNLRIHSINRIYHYLVIAESTFYLSLCIIFLATLEDRWIIYLRNVGPIIHGTYALSLFFDVRNEDAGYKRMFIYGHFVLQIAIPEVLLLMTFIYKENLVEIFIAVLRLIFAILLFFKVGLRLRKLLQKLPGARLDSMYRWMVCFAVPSITPLLYLNFKGIRCFIEQTSEAIEQCENTALVVGHLSIYIVGFVIIAFMVTVGTDNSSREHWLERFATLNLSSKEKVECFFSSLAIACGLFLFSNINNETGRSLPLYIAGGMGSLAIGLVLVMESRATLQQLTDYGGEDEGEEMGEIATSTGEAKKPTDVTELHSWFNAFAFVIVAVSNSFFVLFAITGDIRLPVFGSNFAAIGGSSYIFSILFQPRNQSRKYFFFMVFFFLWAAVPGEFAPAIYSIMNDDEHRGFTTIFLPFIRVLLVYVPFFWLILKLRRYVSRLDDEQLSLYLTVYVLQRWYSTLVPMLFLSFETVACIFEDGGVSVEYCSQSACSTMFLSVNLLLVNIVSLVQKSASKKVQNDVQVSLIDVATLKFTKIRKLQAFLLLVSAVTSLYLLSQLGARGVYNEALFMTGLSGSASLFLIVVLEVTSVVSSNRKHTFRNQLGEITFHLSKSSKSLGKARSGGSSSGQSDSGADTLEVVGRGNDDEDEEDGASPRISEFFKADAGGILGDVM